MSAIGNWWASKKERAPQPTQPPQVLRVPQESDSEVKEAAKAEAMALRRRKGWKASLVTGSQGVTTTASTEKTLLGQ